MKLALAVLVTVSVFASVRCARSGGAWRPIDTNDNSIWLIAGFAVGEMTGDLVLVSIVDGESLIVNGTKYRLTLLVRDPQGVQTRCEAVVWNRAAPSGLFLTSHDCDNHMVS